MMNIRPKFFDIGLPAHHPLRFTPGCGIDQILLSENCFILLAKDHFPEFLKAFHYREKFLLSRSVVTLWLAQYSDKKEIFCCSS